MHNGGDSALCSYWLMQGDSSDNYWLMQLKLGVVFLSSSNRSETISLGCLGLFEGGVKIGGKMVFWWLLSVLCCPFRIQLSRHKTEDCQS